MMKQMRENTKVILWIVVIAFVITIFAVWGLDLQTGEPGQKNSIGSVNGNTITPQQFQTVYNQMVQQYRSSSSSNDLTYSQQEMLREQAWQNIVSNILTDEEIHRLGIRVTDQEVLNYLRTSPPPEVQQYFKDKNGKFDYAAYQQALNNPDADWTAVEALARRQIPLLKLNEYLMAQVHVTTHEIRTAWEAEHIRMTARYVRFPISSETVGDYKPSDDEVQAYYKDHTDDFASPAQAVLDYVRIPIKPTPQDIDDILYTARSVRDQVLSGDEFATVAKTYSQAPTADVGGDAGFILASQRDSTVMDAVAKLKPGEITEPIRTKKGVWVVQLVETKKEKGQTKYHIKEIYFDITAGAATVDSLSSLAQDISHNAKDKGFEQAAAEKGLKVETTQPFRQGGLIPPLGVVPPLSRFAFSNDPGAISGTLGDEKDYYVARVAKRIDKSTKPLDDVHDQIVQTLLYDHKKSAAKRKADAFYTKFRTAPTQFADAAKQYDYKIATTDTFTVRKPPEGMAPASPFCYAALEGPVQQAIPPILSGDAYYVLEVESRTQFDPKEYANQAPALRDRLLQQRVQTYVAYWYDQLKKKAKIQDFRNEAM